MNENYHRLHDVIKLAKKLARERVEENRLVSMSSGYAKTA